MELMLLMQSASGLLVILAILVFLLFFSSRVKKTVRARKIKAKQAVVKPSTDLQYLKSIIKHRKSTNEELKNALELIIKHHGHIHKKLGVRTHPDFDIYMDVLFTICRHPNTSTAIIVKFDKDLEHLNPEYKPEINSVIYKGLNSRGM